MTAEEEKLVEAMASNEVFQGAVYGVPGFHTIEDCARAALAAAREAGWELIHETELTELRGALSEAESSVDYYYENYTE